MPGEVNAGRYCDTNNVPHAIRLERVLALIEGEALLTLALQPECAAAASRLLADVATTRLRCCPDDEL